MIPVILLIWFYSTTQMNLSAQFHMMYYTFLVNALNCICTNLKLIIITTTKISTYMNRPYSFYFLIGSSFTLFENFLYLYSKESVCMQKYLIIYIYMHIRQLLQTSDPKIFFLKWLIINVIQGTYFYKRVQELWNILVPKGSKIVICFHMQSDNVELI